MVYGTRMEQGFRWSDTRDADGYRLPGPDHLGRWAVVALIVSVILHIVALLALDKVQIALGIQQPEELTTGPVNVRRVEVKPYEPPTELPSEETITPPDDSAALLEEVDLLALLPENEEIDMAPDITDPEFALKLSDPLAKGEVDAPEVQTSSNIDLGSDLPEYGRMEEELTPAAVGQITVDPGAVQIEDGELTSFTEDLIKKGNGGLVDNGKLDGIESLDQLLNLPPNLLLSKRTLLPSDLLFEFNQAKLRESAKVGLMKLALLIDKNPGLYCWIEGHTDLIGTDEANIALSKRRAEAVKEYLVGSLRINPDRIYTIGLGESQPLVTEGDAEAQAPNRRVEIKMRKTPPTGETVKATPRPQPAEPAPPRATLVKPNLRAIPVEEPEPAPPRAQLVVPRATPVEDGAPPAPRAIPVEP
jgi:outer membrane protein OmpA-like peptidoglycan-associated protein